jgi:hypothetical protein
VPIEKTKNLVRRIVESRTVRGRFKIDDSFQTALANYAELINKDTKFTHREKLRVIATVSANATNFAKKKGAKTLDANIFVHSLKVLKIPPFDPTDPCTGAARVILSDLYANRKLKENAKQLMAEVS